MNPSQRAPILLLAALTGLGPLTLTAYVPAMPEMARLFGVEAGTMKLSYSMYLIGFGFGQLVYGPVSDALGRRPVIFVGLGIFMAGTLACTATSNPDILLAGRLLQGAGACAGSALARAIVRDTAGPEEMARIMSLIALALGGVPAVAPLLGGYLALWFGWRAIFIAVALAGLAVILAIFWRLPETNRRRDPGALHLGGMLLAYRAALTSPRFLAFAGALSMALGGSFAFHSAGPFVMIELLEVPAHHYGWYAGVMALSFVAGSSTAAALAGRFGPATLVRAAMLACLGGAFVLAIQTAANGLTPIGITAAMCVWVFGVGAILPNAIAGALAPFPHVAGSVSALLGFFQVGVGALAGIIVARLDDGTAWPITLCLLIMAGIGNLVFNRWASRETGSPSSPATRPPPPA